MLAGTHSRLHSDTITLPNKEEQLTFQLLHSRIRRRDAISTRSTRVSDESIIYASLTESTSKTILHRDLIFKY